MYTYRMKNKFERSNAVLHMRRDEFETKSTISSGIKGARSRVSIVHQPERLTSRSCYCTALNRRRVMCFVGDSAC